MRRVIGVVTLIATALTVVASGEAGADQSVANGAPDAAAPAQRIADAMPAPEGGAEALARNPWLKLDTLGDAARPEGDLRRIQVENGRQTMRFTFRTMASPAWDTAVTDRVTGMVFDIDWRNTSLRENRRIVVLKEDGAWAIVIFNGRGEPVCSRYGGVNILPDSGYRIAVPVDLCLGGARVVRISAGLVDDLDDTEVEDTVVDFVPNGPVWGPFIRLP